jgi:bacterioferritin
VAGLFQYWLGAKVAKVPMKEAVIAELLQHATDELRHADLVANRIIQLGGAPATRPKLWYDSTNCGYDAPENPYLIQLLEQNIKGEQCAIGVYNAMLAETREIDRSGHLQHGLSDSSGRGRARGGSPGPARRY